MLIFFTSVAIATTVSLFSFSQPGYGTSIFEESLDSGSFDAGDFFDSATEPVFLPQIDTIKGTLSDGLDIDLYKLSLTDSWSDISVTLDDIYLGLHLFNDAGQFLSPVESVQSLSFAGEAGDTFFLAVNGINPIVSDINPPTLIDWDLENLAGLTVVTDYTITLEYNNETPTSVPEPASILSIALIGGLTCLNRRPKEG